MYTASKTFHFNAGHRLKDHTGICKNIHGHNYKCIINIQASSLDSSGIVVDFKDMSSIGKWLDDHFDHAFLYQEGDEIGQYISEQGLKTYVLPSPPSTEILAELIFHQSHQLGFPVTSVELRETPKCRAIYSAE